MKKRTFVAVSTKSGRKTHLGHIGSSVSRCGCWPVYAVSPDPRLVTCEKCREIDAAFFRKLEGETT